MDIVVWQRIFVQKADSEYSSLPEYSLAHEDMLVMFLDWETGTFTDPVKMPTNALGKDHLWRLLFPGGWFHVFDDWRD